MINFEYGIVFTVLVPIMIGAITFLAKMYSKRLDKIEQKLEQSVNKKEVKELVVDKLAPIQDSIDDLQLKMDKLYEILILRHFANRE